MTALALVQNGGLMSSPSDLIVKGEQVIARSQKNKILSSAYCYETKRDMSKMECQRWPMFAVRNLS